MRTQTPMGVGLTSGIMSLLIDPPLSKWCEECGSPSPSASEARQPQRTAHGRDEDKPGPTGSDTLPARPAHRTVSERTDNMDGTAARYDHAEAFIRDRLRGVLEGHIRAYAETAIHEDELHSPALTYPDEALLADFLVWIDTVGKEPDQ